MKSVVLLLCFVGVAVCSTTHNAFTITEQSNHVPKVKDSLVKLPETNPIIPKTLESTNFAIYTPKVDGSAVVLKSNLPLAAQNQLAAALTSIYQSISDPMQRLQQFQTATTKMYPLYWNVVSNFSNITFYSQYFIYLRIDSDSVLAFGIS
ncbi:hypothetical protein FQR65_LT05653 [Abscondita terminalis]|nr:hypothetical protein FQR65_LT05653 [Abscondita terminalis]